MPKIKIKNLSAEINRRIRLIKTTTSIVEVDEQNGAVVETADYVGICLSPFSNPTINCEGAGEAIELFGFLPNGVPSEVPPSIYVDGVLTDINNLPEWLQPSDAFEFDPQPPEGFYVIDKLRWTNTDTSNHTLRIVIPDTAIGRILMLGTGVVEFVNSSDYGACLAPQSNLVISCEGATTEIYFPTFAGQWNVEFDGVLYPSDGSYMGPFLRSVFGDVIDANDDGFLRIANKDLLPHRIKFIPVQDTGYTAPSDNPTFMSHPDGSLTFCLSSSSSVPIGCAGAISTADTGGIWGSIIMTVNDVPHEGANSIPDLLYIDNHGEELHNTFKNLSDQYLRIHITATELNPDDHGWYENQNFTRSVDFNTGTIDFCLAPASCEPTEFVMTENNLFEGGSVRLDYVIDAPDHGISNISKRFSMTDIAQGTYLSEIVRQVIAQIKDDHSFIAFREGTGGAVANFDYWTYRSTTDGSFRLSGVTGVISNDSITIKFVKNGLNDDLFPLLFPNASADGLTEYSAHSCGTQELVGI